MLNTSKKFKPHIEVSIKKQELVYYYTKGKQKKYKISTSRKAPSCIENSHGTPWGKHSIIEKIGEGQPLGMVFIGRVPVGQHYKDHPDNDSKSLITTRILRLEGLEPGLNKGEFLDSNETAVCCDTYKRYVYIHGTNQEENIGKPASIGCILMKNDEMVELFDLVEPETIVDIKRN